MPLPSTEPNRRRRPVMRLLTGGLALALGGVVLAPVAATAKPVTAPAANVPAVAQAPAVAKAATVPAVTTAVRDLRLGMSGSDVTALQKRLISLHYIDLRYATGVFDARTHHAVVALQKHHGLARDGIVGPITRAKLASPSIPRPRVPRSGGYYEVNLAKQVMYGFSGSSIIRIIDISTGSGRYYTVDGVTYRAVTPTGTFRIQRRIDGWRQSRLGLMWRPAYFYGGYAVHGSSSVPSYPASHGCIRVTIPTMNRIWDYIPVGRIIYIYRS